MRDDELVKAAREAVIAGGQYMRGEISRNDLCKTLSAMKKVLPPEYRCRDCGATSLQVSEKWAGIVQKQEYRAFCKDIESCCGSGPWRSTEEAALKAAAGVE